MSAMVGINDDEAVLVIDDDGFAASKFSGKPWVEGIKFSADETFNGSFRDVTPPARATALLNEARKALSESSERAKSQPDKTQNAQPQRELSPQEALGKAEADADHWGKIATQPNLSPEGAAWAFNVARSARASAKLWGKVVQAQAQQAPGDPVSRRPLNLPSPPPSSDPTTLDCQLALPFPEDGPEKPFVNLDGRDDTFVERMSAALKKFARK